jgi:VWFA-related protein
MLSFLRALPAMERVALYILKPSGFEVLQEGTDDHALLALKLKGWMRSAQDLARAQESEERNRQQFDYVLNPADLQSVNGNTDMGPETVTGVDPELRDNGSNPERRALSVLAVVARHLAAIPGHKNLVWVTSDNVLANWADKAVGSDKGSKHNEEFALRIQEAMNDAHVSIYPLDASQLETMAVDASLANANVELSPSVTAPPQPQGGGAGAGRITAELQQDIHPIQAQLQQMAKATGGQAFSRTSDIARNLAQVAADGRAEYLLSFTPDTPADGQYHLLTVKLAGRRGIALRYRAGYEYLKEPATLKDRFRQAVWQSLDASEIGVSAHLVPASEGATVQVDIATHDLALKQQDDRWQDQLDIFLVRRDDEGLHSLVTEQTLKMNLTAATYTKLLQQGTPFNQFIERKPETGSVRIIVVDENSGRMGSVTVPALALPSAN